ncbi:hypothetical protein IFM89_002419 [Coptis chinensis]|uniref:Fe2OG dioxygenase domain-containing protein n=1 Tax=Coptis chinensis TaxID=261450 RepID=A0A835IKB9_9MAGN|nr:hypothetical protein IFM89_002419 [Coptis chinensis]
MSKPVESPTQSNLSDLLPYLSEGFCSGCKELLEARLQNLNYQVEVSLPNGHNSETSTGFCSANSSSFWTPEKSTASSNLSTSSSQISVSNNSSPASVTSNWKLIGSSVANEIKLNGEIAKASGNGTNGKVSSADEKNSSMSLAEEQKRILQIGRKKDFECVEMIKGRPVNVLQGLELHTRVFNDEEQKKIVDYVYDLQRMGQSRKLRERTYLEPQKWMRGKGRVTIQFGCCYNYAVDKNGNPPGITRDEEVDPIPPLFKSMIKRMVKWRILPTSCIPNSCIVNIYNEGDCIPPHIDHHDFVRPFCTVSFLTESDILFGTSLKPVGEGDFSGAAKIPLPVGSVLILKGNGADIAKHCVPAVLRKRISITFRKMDDSKLPFKFLPDPELQGIQPLGSSQLNKLSAQQVPSLPNLHNRNRISAAEPNTASSPIQFGNDDFPPLGAPTNKKR